MGKLLQFQGKVGNPVHGFGLIPDPKGHRYNGFHLHSAVSVDPATLPARTYNLKLAPPIWDQGSTGSCFGHGMAGQITTTFAAHGKPLPSPVSPASVYKITRAIDRTNIKVALQDVGSQPNSGVRAIALWGANIESEVDGGRTAASADYTSFLEAHVNDEPKLGDMEKSAKRILAGFNSVDDDDSQKLVKFQQSLASGHTIGVGVDAGGKAFQEADGRQPLGFCGSEPDHWTYLVDYALVGQMRKDGDLPESMSGLPDTQRLWYLINSWGLLWPNYTFAGGIWLTDDFVQRGCLGSLVTNLEI
jgi:hypothetical protein